MGKLIKAIGNVRIMLFTATVLTLLTNFIPSVTAQVANTAPVIDPVSSFQMNPGAEARHIETWEVFDNLDVLPTEIRSALTA